MIQFPSLLQAIDYAKRCPLCKKSIHFESDIQVNRQKGLNQYTGLNKYINTAIDWEQDPRNWTTKTTLTFTDVGGTSYTDIISICLETHEVKRKLSYHQDLGYGTNGLLTSYSVCSPSPTVKGDKYLGLGMVCTSCNNYNFMIQIVIALEFMAVSKVLLNSESMSFFEKGGMSEIRNIYTLDKTEYNFFSGEPIKGDPYDFVRSQTLPLIPLDKENPLHTLQRVKNLLIFT